MQTDYISYHRPSIGEEEIAEVVATLRSGWITSGGKARQFEQEFAERVEAPFALAVNSCTSALHLALAALNIGPGDEVITTPLTFCATVNTILHTGATPVLADIDGTGNIDPASIAARITARTRAIVPVHYAGLPCDLDAIWDLAEEHGLKVVEDAAHALGATYSGAPIGAPVSGRRSDAVAFSFYATKNITTGEGGMVTTACQELAERMRRLCLHGISRDAWGRYADRGNWYYQVEECGFKYNLSDIQAAIGIHQLRRLDEFTEARARYANLYQTAFADVEEVEIPAVPPGRTHCWHLYPLRLDLTRLDIHRAQFIQELQNRGVGASVHFIPIPLHPFFSPYAGLPHNRCERALQLYPRLVSLPLYPAMTEAQVCRVIDTVKEIVSAHQLTRSVHASMHAAAGWRGKAAS
ncbi:MAG: DegT/DnrJ/EryC1/StrS aminotransferase family protein [Acidobacteriia bacterium]|nr:DegT/DnrJ/EryC1/StrS aminotransferase family protein [Terriglobia bacterium]